MIKLAFAFMLCGMAAFVLGLTAVPAASVARFFAVLFALLAIAFLLFGLDSNKDAVT